MSQAANHVKWCLEKAKKELEEAEKQGKAPKHRGLAQVKPSMSDAKKYMEKADHNLKSVMYMVKGGFTDWAVSAIGSKRWKFIHRFVYLAYLAAIFHFLTIHTEALYNPEGYLLLAVTAITVIGQLYWFFIIAGRKQFKTVGAFVGFGLIALAIILSYLILVSRV